MIWTFRLRSLWRNLVHRQRSEQDLDDEVRAYAAILEDENAARGLTLSIDCPDRAFHGPGRQTVALWRRPYTT